MTFGSLFTGIGGFDQGLERAGMTCSWQVEIDPFRRAVLARHWPDVERHADVTTIDVGQLPRVDVVAAGFPCQDTSHAGSRAGVDDGVRSILWHEVIRVVRGTGARWVIVENVPGLLHRGFDTVLRTLAASGFDAWWDCVPATAAGAPHRRDRIWLVAHPTEAVRRWPRQRRQGCQLPWRRPAGGHPRWPAEPRVGRVADGVPPRSYERAHALARLNALGDSLMPQIAEQVGRGVMEVEHATHR